MEDQKKYFKKKYLEMMLVFFVISTNIAIIMPEEKFFFFTRFYSLFIIFGLFNLWHDANTHYVEAKDKWYNITFDFYCILIMFLPIILFLIFKTQHVFEIKFEPLRLTLLIILGMLELSHYRKQHKKFGILRGYFTTLAGGVLLIFNTLLLVTSIIPISLNSNRNETNLLPICIMAIIFVLWLIKKMLGKHPLKKALLIGLATTIFFIIWATNNPSKFNALMNSTESFVANIL